MLPTDQEAFISGVTLPQPVPGAALLFAFRGRELLVLQQPPAPPAVPSLDAFTALALTERQRHYLGHSPRLGHCLAVALEEDAAPPPATAFSGLRELYGRLDDDLLATAGRGVQIVEWAREHQFCGQCGGPTQAHEHERARVCPACQRLYFPRLSPAVIVLIHRGAEFLLARNHRFPAGRYSIIAGFVEPGESVEQAVRREVREEVDLEITDLRYFGSQPWPFPNSLMLGFTAAYAAGDLRLADGELADAGWYSRDRAALPDLPDGMSISRKLIEHFLAGGCGT